MKGVCDDTEDHSLQMHLILKPEFLNEPPPPQIKLLLLQ